MSDKTLPSTQEMHAALTAAQENPQTLPAHHTTIGTILGVLLKILPLVESVLGIIHPGSVPAQQVVKAEGGEPVNTDAATTTV